MSYVENHRLKFSMLSACPLRFFIAVSIRPFIVINNLPCRCYLSYILNTLKFTLGVFSFRYYFRASIHHPTHNLNIPSTSIPLVSRQYREQRTRTIARGLRRKVFPLCHKTYQLQILILNSLIS